MLPEKVVLLSSSKVEEVLGTFDITVDKGIPEPYAPTCIGFAWALSRIGNITPGYFFGIEIDGLYYDTLNDWNVFYVVGKKPGITDVLQKITIRRTDNGKAFEMLMDGPMTTWRDKKMLNGPIFDDSDIGKTIKAIVTAPMNGGGV